VFDIDKPGHAAAEARLRASGSWWPKTSASGHKAAAPSFSLGGATYRLSTNSARCQHTMLLSRHGVADPCPKDNDGSSLRSMV
jgi:hypothetical protein